MLELLVKLFNELHLVLKFRPRNFIDLKCLKGLDVDFTVENSLKYVLVKELAETLCDIIVVDHSGPNVICNDFLYYRSEFLFEVVHLGARNG